jgi:tetratricopeptide (TPR) repeat protein
VLGRANRAVSLSRDNVRGYYVKGLYLSNSRRPDEALGVVDAGLALNPNFATLLVPRAVAENSLGRYEQARTDAQLAMRLSPRDPSLGSLHLIMGASEFGLGHLEAAIDQFHQAIDTGFGAYFIYSNLSAAYAQAGKMDEAKAAMAEARRLNPKLTSIKWLMEHTGVLQRRWKPSARRGSCRRNERSPRRMRPEATRCAALGTRCRTKGIHESRDIFLHKSESRAIMIGNDKCGRRSNPRLARPPA